MFVPRPSNVIPSENKGYSFVRVGIKFHTFQFTQYLFQLILSTTNITFQRVRQPFNNDSLYPMTPFFDVVLFVVVAAEVAGEELGMMDLY